MKKYEFTGEVKIWLGRTLRQIRATVAFGIVKAGEVGGWIEKEENLSQTGNAWVSGDARVSGNARVYGNALVSGNAWVYGDALVSGNAWVYGDAWVSGDARVYGNAWVSGDALVSGNAWVSGDARVYGNALVYGDARVYDQAHWLCIGPIGSRNDFTTFFRTKSLEIFVKCGCFRGDIQTFAEKVKQTHGDNNHAKQYMAAVELAKVCIDLAPFEE